MNKRFGNKAFNLAILAVACPIMLQAFITSSINFMDSLMVGSLGDIAVGSIASVNRFYTLMNSAAASIVGGSAIYIGQFYGANMHKETKQAFNVGLVSAYAIIAVFFILSALIPTQIIGFFNADTMIIEVGSSYLNIVKYTFLPLGISLALSSALQACGKTSIPLFVSGGSIALKLILNIMMLKSGAGVEGVAFATLVARVIEMICYITITKWQHFVFLDSLRGIMDVPLSLYKRILLTSIPLTFNNFLWAASNSYILKLFGSRGVLNYNAYAICATINDMFNSLNSGFGTAISLLVAQELGKESLEYTKSYALKTYPLAFFVDITLGILMMITSLLIPIIYPNMNIDVVRIAKVLILLQGITYIFYGMGMHNYFLFKAGGDTKSIAIMDSIATWIVKIPIMMIFAYYTNCSIYILFLSSQIGEIIKMFISFVLVKKERWLNNLTAL